MKLMHKTLAIAMTTALATGLPFAACAQGNPGTEVATAHAHALMAQGADSVAMTHTHLHHVVNCLVGTKGAGFDASAGNPCKDQGNGAIPDSVADHALHAKLGKALAAAQAGLKSQSLSDAQHDAGKAAKILQAASTPKPKTGSSSW
ncbi:MAG TPA: hypothetical protein VFY97_08695 [Rhodanobacteraceae bacterium]|nr:hypothetical protein [Rhodanobacteraceae bacterium]